MRPGKQAISDEVRNHLDASGFAILADYRGMTVEQFSDLRGRMKKVNSRVQVVKNSIFSRAAGDIGWSVHDRSLQGPTMMVFGAGDVAATAKALKDFVKELGLPVVKGGVLDAQAISKEEVDAMASMPSREIMLGMFVGTVAALMTQLVGVLNQKVLSLLYVLKAAADKRGGE